MASSSVDSKEDGSGWAGADFSGLDDLGALRQFLGSNNYLLEGVDSNDESHDLSRECFVCDRELREGASDKNEGEHTSAGLVARTVAHARVRPCHRPWGDHSPS